MSWLKMVAAVLGHSNKIDGAQDCWDPWEPAVLMCKEGPSGSRLLSSHNASFGVLTVALKNNVLGGR